MSGSVLPRFALDEKWKTKFFLAIATFVVPLTHRLR